MGHRGSSALGILTAFIAASACACTIAAKEPEGGSETKPAAPSTPADPGASSGASGASGATPPGGTADAPKELASRSAADDKDFTERLESANEECGTKLIGRITSPTLSVSYCSNLADGLLSVCQDNPGNKAIYAGLASVVCGDTKAGAPTAEPSKVGTALDININETMSDPSERVRCTVAKLLKVTYKGDLDDACLERK
jgi:hypothetical protein